MPEFNPYAPGEVSKAKPSPAPVEFPGHHIKLSFIYDLNYLIEAINQYRTRSDSSFGRLIGLVVRWWVALICVGYALFTFSVRGFDQYIAPVFFLALGALVMFMRNIENFVLRRRYRSAPSLNQRFEITLTDEGYLSKSSLHDAKLLWSVFTEAIESRDGVLLLEGKHRYHWFPFRALEDQEQSSILYRYISSRLFAGDEATPHESKLPDHSVEGELSSSVPGDQIKATIIYDSNFLIETLTRLRKHSGAGWWTVIRYAVAAVLLCLGAALIGTDLYWLAIASFVFAVAIVFRLQLRNFQVARHMKKSPHNNERLAITLSDHGCHLTSVLQNADLLWSSFTEVAQFPDGVLLCRGLNQGIWLPYRCLENESDTRRLYEFVSSRIINRKSTSETPSPQALQQTQEVE